MRQAGPHHTLSSSSIVLIFAPLQRPKFSRQFVLPNAHTTGICSHGDVGIAFPLRFHAAVVPEGERPGLRM